MNRLFKHKIFDNVGIKVFSIVFAIIFWIYVMDQVNPVITKRVENVPITFTNVETVKNDGFVVADNESRFVDVIISGRRSEVIRVNSGDVVLTADLLGYNKGINNIPIDKRVSNANVEIEEMSRNSIKVELDVLVERSKDVEVSQLGSLPASFYMKNLEVNPDEVIVYGPENNVNNVNKLVGTITLDNITSSVNKDIPIMAVDSNGGEVQGVQLNGNYVNVKFEVVKRKTVEIQPDVTNELSENYRITTDTLAPEQITIQGKEEIIDEIDSITTEPITINDDTTEIDQAFNLIIPEGVELVDGNNTVDINIQVEEIISSEYIFNPDEITTDNLNSDYDVNYLEELEPITANITSVKSVIDQINREDLELKIDFSNFTPGTKRVPFVLEYPEFDEAVEVDLSKKSIQVEIIDTTDEEQTNENNDNELNDLNE